MSRWENDKEPVGPTSEKLLRLIVAQFLGDKAPALDIDKNRIASMRIRSTRLDTKPVEMRFRPVQLKVARRRQPAWEQVGEAA